MLILAIDLGKAKSLACWYQADDATHEFRTVPTRPADFHSLLLDRPVDRVVIEICDAAGWTATRDGSRDWVWTPPQRIRNSRTVPTDRLGNAIM